MAYQPPPGGYNAPRGGHGIPPQTAPPGQNGYGPPPGSAPAPRGYPAPGGYSAPPATMGAPSQFAPPPATYAPPGGGGMPNSAYGAPGGGFAAPPAGSYAPPGGMGASAPPAAPRSFAPPGASARGPAAPPMSAPPDQQPPRPPSMGGSFQSLPAAPPATAAPGGGAQFFRQPGAPAQQPNQPVPGSTFGAGPPGAGPPTGGPPGAGAIPAPGQSAPATFNPAMAARGPPAMGRGPPVPMAQGYPGAPAQPGMQAPPGQPGMAQPGMVGGPGYPGAPGQPGMAPPGMAPGMASGQPGPGGYAQRPAAPAQPAKPAPRIDPSQIPRMPRPPVGAAVPTWGSQALLGRVVDNKAGPPVACMPFRAIDEGNATPRFVRPTLHHCPASRDLLNQMKMPFGVHLQPMAAVAEGEEPIHEADLGPNGPVRCQRCKGYVNCFVKWLNDGSKWQCNLCDMVNDTPQTYYSSLDGNGYRHDSQNRPELSRGSVDFVGTKDYCVRPVQEPIVVFVVDTSAPAVSSGLTKATLDAIVDMADATIEAHQEAMTGGGGGAGGVVGGNGGATGGFPGGARARVGIVTFDRNVQFYRIREDTGEVCTVIMGDIEDPFAPIPPQHFLLRADGLTEKAVKVKAQLQKAAEDGVYVDPATVDPAANEQVDVEKFRGQLEQLSQHVMVHAAKVQEAAAAAPNSLAGTVGCSIAALVAAADGLSEVGGRVELVTAGAPLIGIGRLRPRERTTDYGGEREAELYRPLSTQAKGKEEQDVAAWYTKFADDCALRQIGVDVYVAPVQRSSLSMSTATTPNGSNPMDRGGGHDSMPNAWIDMATLGLIPKATGGKAIMLDGGVDAAGALTKVVIDKLENELRLSMVTDRKTVASETVTKVRCSTGLRCAEYHGPGVQRSVGELEIAAMHPFTNVLCILKHDSALKNDERVYVQAATLYSSLDGRRMVRVHNLCMLAATGLPELFRLADLDAVFTANVKLHLPRLLKEPLTTVRDAFTELCADALYNYRVSCAKTSPAGQLILPESLKLMPLYTLGLLKSVGMRPNSPDSGRGGGGGPDPRADERAAHLAILEDMTVSASYRLLHPRMYDLEKISTDAHPRAFTPLDDSEIHFAIPLPLPCSAEHLSNTSAFLLDGGSHLLLQVGKDAPPDLLDEVLAQSHADPTKPQELSEGSDLGGKVACMLKEMRHDLPFYAPLQIYISGGNGPEERRLLSLLIEDKTKHEISYVDYLCAVHRRIQQKMA